MVFPCNFPVSLFGLYFSFKITAFFFWCYRCCRCCFLMAWHCDFFFFYFFVTFSYLTMWLFNPFPSKHAFNFQSTLWCCSFTDTASFPGSSGPVVPLKKMTKKRECKKFRWIDELNIFRGFVKFSHLTRPWKLQVMSVQNLWCHLWPSETKGLT